MFICLHLLPWKYSFGLIDFYSKTGTDFAIIGNWKSVYKNALRHETCP